MSCHLTRAVEQDTTLVLESPKNDTKFYITYLIKFMLLIPK